MYIHQLSYCLRATARADVPLAQFQRHSPCPARLRFQVVIFGGSGRQNPGDGGFGVVTAG